MHEVAVRQKVDKTGQSRWQSLVQLVNGSVALPGILLPGILTGLPRVCTTRLAMVGLFGHMSGR